MFELKAVKMFIPELDKGEKNPYVNEEDELGNPYMKNRTIHIKEDAKDVLNLLEKKDYDVSEMQ